MNKLIENLIYEMGRKQCKGGIDIYIDGVIYDRCADLSEVIKLLKAKDEMNDLVDIRLSVKYTDVDIITATGIKENMAKWYSTR